LCVVVVWGVNFVAMKVGLHSFTPFQLGAARYLAASIPMVFLVRRPQLNWRWLVAYGLTQGFGQFGLLFCAMQVGMTASLASVLQQTQIFWTAVLGFALLGERAKASLKLGLVLAGAGLLCFGLNYWQAGATGGTTVWGFALTLCASFMWASSNIVTRLASRQGGKPPDALAFVAWSSMVPVLPFAAMSWCFDAPTTHWRWTETTAGGWAAVVYLGWGASLLGYGLWTRLLQRHPANRVAPFSLGVPLVGMSAGMGLLGEQITGWQWAGIVLVVLAMGCVLAGDRWLDRARAGA
jgi:O-acetylserine/cysteine efflux transporter